MDRVSRDQHFFELCQQRVARRWFLKECGVGLGAIALGELMRESARAKTTVDDPLAPKDSHFAATGKARHLSIHGRRSEPPRAL